MRLAPEVRSVASGIRLAFESYRLVAREVFCRARERAERDAYQDSLPRAIDAVAEGGADFASPVGEKKKWARGVTGVLLIRIRVAGSERSALRKSTRSHCALLRAPVVASKQRS